jgi:hypothetical protein
MAEMTIERADRILEAYRSHGSFRNMTDFGIAKALHARSANTSISAAFFVMLNLMQYVSGSSNRYLHLGTAIVTFLIAVYFHFKARRFNQIRDLFESQAPQHLNQLEPGSSLPHMSSSSPENW